MVNFPTQISDLSLKYIDDDPPPLPIPTFRIRNIPLSPLTKFLGAGTKGGAQNLGRGLWVLGALGTRGKGPEMVDLRKLRDIALRRFCIALRSSTSKKRTILNSSV